MMKKQKPRYVMNVQEDEDGYILSPDNAIVRKNQRRFQIKETPVTSFVVRDAVKEQFRNLASRQE